MTDLLDSDIAKLRRVHEFHCTQLSFINAHDLAMALLHYLGQTATVLASSVVAASYVVAVSIPPPRGKYHIGASKHVIPFHT